MFCYLSIYEQYLPQLNSHTIYNNPRYVDILIHTVHRLVVARRRSHHIDHTIIWQTSGLIDRIDRRLILTNVSPPQGPLLAQYMTGRWPGRFPTIGCLYRRHLRRAVVAALLARCLGRVAGAEGMGYLLPIAYNDYCLLQV